MSHTLAPLKIPKDLHEWIEAKKAKTGSSYSVIQRDAMRLEMDRDKRKAARGE
jgi:hypothetical protein|tara:strand:+ start:679 stop:837 length:159 start_codon:yes stop_codon:yes gene_type:complete